MKKKVFLVLIVVLFGISKSIAHHNLSNVYIESKGKLETSGSTAETDLAPLFSKKRNFFKEIGNDADNHKFSDSLGLYYKMFSNCETIVPNYDFDFSNYIDDCWAEGDNTTITEGFNGQDGSWASDGFLNSGSVGAAKINLYSAGQKDWLVSPTFDLSAGNYFLVFDVGVVKWNETNYSNMGSDDEVQVLISNDDGASWINLETFNAWNLPSNLGEEKIYDLSAYTSSSTIFAFWASDGTINDSEDYDFFIDNFSVTNEVCIEPESLTATDVTIASAVIGWDLVTGMETDWEIVVQPNSSGVPTGAGTAVTGTNSYAATSLVSNTNYECYVRTNCGEGNYSSWAGPYFFRTKCGAFVPEYTYSFPSYSFDFCWAEGNDTFVGDEPNEQNGNWTTGDFLNEYGSRAAKITISGIGDRDWLVSPTFDLSTGGYELRYDVGLTEFGTTNSSSMGSDDEIQVLISNDDGASWINLETFNVTNAPSHSGQVEVYNLAAYTSSTTKFAFWVNEGTVIDSEQYDFFVDNFNVRSIPACHEPGILTTSAITNTSAVLGWAAVTGSETDWEVVLQTSGSGTPAGAGTSTGGAITHTSTSLVPNTGYEFYVRTNCGGGSYSSWSGPYFFRTKCDVFVPEYEYDFQVYGAGSCWTEGNGTSIAEGPNEQEGSWTSDGFLNVGSAGAAKINLYNTGRKDWLISPVFDLSAGDYGLVFDVGVTEWNTTNQLNMGSDDEVQVLISNDNGVNWINLETFNTSNTPSYLGETKTYDLAGYTSSTTKFAFWASDGTVNDPQDYDFFIDNFKVLTYTTLNVGDLEYEKSFAFYPNPVENVLNVSAKSRINGLTVINALGQTVKVATPGLNNYQLDLSDLNNGVYFVKASINNSEETFRIIKK